MRVTAWEFHAIASPPEAPMASTATDRQPGQALESISPRVELLHLVSWRKHICGFSIFIMFFNILSFPGLLSPLRFQDTSFMDQLLLEGL